MPETVDVVVGPADVVVVAVAAPVVSLLGTVCETMFNLRSVEVTAFVVVVGAEKEEEGEEEEVVAAVAIVVGGWVNGGGVD